MTRHIAPTTPTSEPSLALCISTRLTDSLIALDRIIRRRGLNSLSPMFETPPPITMRSGLNIVTRLPRPMLRYLIASSRISGASVAGCISPRNNSGVDPVDVAVY